jgi:hypothetical protein
VLTVHFIGLGRRGAAGREAAGVGSVDFNGVTFLFTETAPRGGELEGAGLGDEAEVARELKPGCRRHVAWWRQQPKASVTAHRRLGTKGVTSRMGWLRPRWAGAGR